jgi:hypothetical protein
MGLPNATGAARPAGWESVLWDEIRRADRVWVAVAAELAAVPVSSMTEKDGLLDRRG